MFWKIALPLYRHLFAYSIIAILLSSCIAQEKTFTVPNTQRYDTIIKVEANSLYNKNFSWVIKDGYWGVLNAENKLIVPCRYTIPVVMGEYYSRSSGDGCLFQTTNPAILLTDSAFTDLVDLNKGVLSPPGIQFLRKTGEYFVFSSDRKKYGLLSNTGQTIIPEVSETCIYQIFDSLFLLSYNNSFAIHDVNNSVIVPTDKFSELDYRKAINYFIKHGAYNNSDRFEFDTVNITEDDFIPALQFFYAKYWNYDGYSNEKNNPKNMIHQFINSNIDPCDFEGCFRYLDAYFDDIDVYQVDLDCSMNIYSVSDNPYHSIKGLGNGIIEYRYMNLMASQVRVYGELSYYDYGQVRNNKLDTLGFSDFFSNPNQALLSVNQFIDSLIGSEEGETLMKIDSVERTITLNSNFSLDKEAITFWLYFENEEKTFGSNEDQYEVRIPYEYLESYIENDGLIRKIQHYEKSDY
jgi:hypothetical protein